MPYVPPALRKGDKYASFRKGTSMKDAARTKFRQGDYVFYKNSEARIAKVKAGYDGEPNLYQIRWQGTLVDKVPETEISLKMLEHDDLMAAEIASPTSSGASPEASDAAAPEKEPRSKSLRGLRSRNASANRSSSYISGTKSARGPRRLQSFGGSFRSLSLADEDPGQIRGTKKQSDEVVWQTGDNSIVYDHTRVKNMQNVRRATPQNSGRGIITRSDPGLRKPRTPAAMSAFLSSRSASSRSLPVSEDEEPKERMRAQRGFRNRRQAPSKFTVAPPSSRSKSDSPKAFDMDALKKMVDLRSQN